MVVNRDGDQPNQTKPNQQKPMSIDGTAKTKTKPTPCHTIQQ